MIYKKAIICKTKNLFSTSTAVGTLKEGGPNIARNFEEGKWYIGFTSNNYYNPSTVNDYRVEENLVYYKRIANWTNGYGLARAFRCEPNTDYAISFSATATAGVVPNCGYYDEEGNYLSNFNYGGSIQHLTITTPANCKWLVVVLNIIGIGEAYFSNLQLELGSTATNYVPNGYLQSYKKAIKVSDICQLVNSKLFTPMNNDDYALAGVSITKNIEAGTITFNGTSTNNFWYHVHDFGSELKYTNLIKGYKYYISGMPVNDLGVVFQLTSLFNLQGEQIFTAPKTSDGTGAFNIYVPKGVTLTDFVVTPQLFNLTEMYKAGNEPTTVEEFKSRWYKNLFVPSTAVGTLGGWDQPTARQFEEDKWYIGLTGNNYYLPGNIVEYELTENSIYVNTKGNGYGITRAFKCESDTHYVVSWIYGDNTTDKSKAYVEIGYYDVGGNYIMVTSSALNTTHVGFTTPANCKWFTVDFTSRTPNSLYVSNLQLEKGPAATPYVPYTPNPAPYRPYCFVNSYKKYLKIKENNNA
nr:MAG TPA: hypothetical protein [Caudoviricetes sp.]